MIKNYTYLLLFIACLLNSCSKQEPRPVPKAAFMWANSGEGSIQFTDQSTEADTYSWNFGDGESSSDKNPKHVFPGNAKYTVVLTVTNPSGTDKISKQVDVSSFSAPVPNFSLTQGEDGQVSFTNLSTNADTYLWSFGNGKTSTEKIPSIKYEENKKYTISLSVYGKGGEAKLDKEVEIVSIKPVVDFTYTVSNGEVTFINKTKNADSYSWNFGNGLVSTDMNPTTRYTRTGTYTVTLTAKGKAGQVSKNASVSITTIDLVDDKEWADYLPGVWGAYVDGPGYKFDNYNYTFFKGSNLLKYKNYYSPYQYVSGANETINLDYRYTVLSNIMYVEDYKGLKSKYARIQIISEDEMKIFRISESATSYTEYTPYILTRTNDIEKPVSSAIESEVVLSTLNGIWDQGNYSIYNNVFFDFTAGKNYYQYNYTFNEAKRIEKYEFKINSNNIMSYRSWNSSFDPSWKKYKVELVNSSTIKLYPINANGVVSSTADYTLRKR